MESVHDIGADRTLLYRGDKLLDDLEVDIRLQKSHLDFPHCGLNVALCQTSLAAQVPEYFIQFIGQILKCH